MIMAAMADQRAEREIIYHRLRQVIHPSKSLRFDLEYTWSDSTSKVQPFLIVIILILVVFP